MRQDGVALRPRADKEVEHHPPGVGGEARVVVGAHESSILLGELQ
jgi:hypothetical protein